MPVRHGKTDILDAAQGEQRARRVRRWLLLALLVCLSLLLICAGAAAVFVLRVCSAAPELEVQDVVPDGYRTTVTDNAGDTILTLMGEEANRIYVTLDEMPKELCDAFTAIEDERFWTHHGVDPRAVMRAAWRAITAGSLTEGASTITQQLIKNNVLTGWTAEKTAMDKITRKIQEQYLAIRLDKEYSKEWILENYLNSINLGGGSWGVETASLRYFGKDVSQLTLSECAVLAAIPKSPSAYNPVSHPEANRQRRELVLAKMLELGNITQEEYDGALADDVYVRIGESGTGVETQIFSFFEDAMLRQVIGDLVSELGYTENEAWQLVYRGGLTIVTTQDTSLQRLSEQTINDDSLYSSDAQASLVLIDNSTGQVRAIVGGRGEKTASLTLNRAVSSVRQPGSTIKIPGEYAAALEAGIITLGTVYDDAPTSYSDGTEVRNSGGEYGGRSTVRTAIERSVNTVALQCFRDAGMEAVWQSLGRFGFAHLDEEDKVEALALGGTHGGVTNLELTAAYSAIANGGTYYEPAFYTRIFDHEGRLLLQRAAQPRRVVSSDTAHLLTEAMTGVLTRGTGVAARFDGTAIAGKSGTTTEARDVWFVGFSPDYTCGVWGGFDDNGVQSDSGYVKRIWKEVMQGSSSGGGFDRSGLVSRTICLKCGKLAVEELCGRTVQGDQSREEYYVPGTEPEESCDCHVAAEVCTVSEMPAGEFCPEEELERRVYLKSGTAGTADESAVYPFDDEICTEHKDSFHWLFPGWNIGGSDAGGASGDPEYPSGDNPEGQDGHGGTGSWWSDFRDWLGW